MTKVATIAADVSKKRVLCRVSMDILIDKFGEMEEGPLRMLAANRVYLQDAARRLIERDAYEEDGSIVIRAGDLDWLAIRPLPGATAKSFWGAAALEKSGFH
jgi:hypothetical protein